MKALRHVPARAALTRQGQQPLCERGASAPALAASAQQLCFVLLWCTPWQQRPALHIIPHMLSLPLSPPLSLSLTHTHTRTGICTLPLPPLPTRVCQAGNDLVHQCRQHLSQRLGGVGHHLAPRRGREFSGGGWTGQDRTFTGQHGKALPLARAPPPVQPPSAIHARPHC